MERTTNRIIKRNKRKKARRLVGMIAVIIFVFLSVIVWPMLKPSSTEAMEKVQVVMVTVEKGDSLWSIAERYDNNKMDLRQYIDLILGFNNLKSNVLKPGQRINIPIYASK